MAQTILDVPEVGRAAYYFWSIPGSPMRVHLSLDVVERLQTFIQEGSEHQGLLWGTNPGRTEIRDATPLPGTEPPSLNAVDSVMPPSPGLVPVGYYRIQDRELRLDRDDVSWAKAVMPAPYQVILVIQPQSVGPARATFFFWDGGQMFADFPFLEFPLDHNLLARIEQQKLEAEKDTRLAEASLSTAAKPARNQPGYRTPVFVLCGALAVLVGGVPFAASRFLSPTHASDTAAARAAAVRTDSAPATTDALGFRVERQNTELRLTWNSQSAAIQNATSGTFVIEDSTGKYTIMLDSDQIRTGGFLYTPSADQVALRLTVAGPQQTYSESVIVILPKRSFASQSVARRHNPEHRRRFAAARKAGN